MKKVLLIICGLIIGQLIGKYAYGYLTAPKWEVQTSTREGYAQLYSYKGCTVDVRPQGRGVHFTSTSNGEVGEPVFFGIYERDDEGITHTSMFPNGEDLFFDYCARAARGLPDTAQAGFRGLYGLGDTNDWGI